MLAFIEKAPTQGKPFFIWFNTTRLHIWTRLAPEYLGKSGKGIYADGMTEHNETVGALLRTAANRPTQNFAGYLPVNERADIPKE